PGCRRPCWASTPARSGRPCSAASEPMSADPLYQEVTDPGSLAPFGEEIEAGNPSGWPTYARLLQRARRATGARHAGTTGPARVGGHPCVVVGFEYAFIGGALGVAEEAKHAAAVRTA